MRIFSETDTGLVRSSNQDAACSGVFEDGAVWAAVFDGMGGASGGEVASSIAAETVTAVMNELYPQSVSSMSEARSGSLIREIMRTALLAANGSIYREARDDLRLEGMGTTAVLAVVTGGTAYIAHAGDSRAYQLSDGRISQLTVDHSMVQELVDMGSLTPEQARNHPRKNIITRVLGVYRNVEPDFTETRLDGGDMLLLCTDGLCGCAEDGELLAVARTVPPEALCGEYIKLAYAKGGHDNITALIICN